MRTKKPKVPLLQRYKTYDPKVEGYGDISQWRSAWESMNPAEAAGIIQNESPLEIMGFSVMPTAAELDQRYRKLVLEHHPDHGGDRKIFQKVHAAWILLKDKL